ncbi:D-alanyl-D-alanine carboxypeptidase family protein [Patescibacteria group bacterium]
MNKGLKFFLIAFLVSLPFWWGANILEENLKDFLFWQEISRNPQILAAKANQQILEQELKNLKPIRNWQVENIEIEAESAISVFSIDSNSKILFEKNIQKKLPIASLTKLMTAYVVLENYNLSQKTEISKEAVAKEEEFGNLKVGEVFTIKGLLYPLLMESSNDAAYALAELISEPAFVDLMNLEAEKMSLENTHFANSTGLDPDDPTDPQNYSSNEDLVKLTKYLFEKPLIWEILSASEFDLYLPDGVFHHTVLSTNEFLGELDQVVGGKTGYTPEAKGCFLLVLKAPKNQGLLINVILGSGNRFGEMKKLVDWLKIGYKW